MTELPTAATMLLAAIDASRNAPHLGALNTDGWLRYSRLLLDIARELREGSATLDQPTDAVRSAALAAFGARPAWTDADVLDQSKTHQYRASCGVAGHPYAMHLCEVAGRAVTPTQADRDRGYAATTYGDLAEGRTMEIQAVHTYDTPTEVDDLEQPMPTPNGTESIQAKVRHDLHVREQVGIQRYGTPLQAHNGRDALRDAYEEALDLACYLKQKLVEEAAPPVPAEDVEPGQVVASADDKPGCPVRVWDGPYEMRCSMGTDQCATHGRFETHTSA